MCSCVPTRPLYITERVQHYILIIYNNIKLFLFKKKVPTYIYILICVVKCTCTRLASPDTPGRNRFYYYYYCRRSRRVHIGTEGRASAPTSRASCAAARYNIPKNMSRVRGGGGGALYDLIEAVVAASASYTPPETSDHNNITYYTLLLYRYSTITHTHTHTIYT